MTEAPNRQKVGFVSTSNYALDFFLKSYIEAIAEEADVILLANTEHGVPAPRKGIEYIEMPFKRQPSPHHDLMDLIKLTKMIRSYKLDAVYTISPKGGLLGMLASTLARVPVRLHFFTGQVWVTRTGFAKRFLKGLDQIIGRACSFALVDSPSQRDFLIKENVLRADKSVVLGAGSVAGIDTDRFAPNPEMRKAVRDTLGIPQTMPIILFLGRLTRDKGVLDLVEAFKTLAEKHDNLGLVMAGPDEGMLDSLKSALAGSKAEDRVWFPGQTSTPEHYFAAADLFCLPSYREGFGVVILEAAATGLPAVGSDIYGVCDAIVDNETGILHTPADSGDIASALDRLIADPALRDHYGKAALTRARDVFGQSIMVEHFRAFHRKMMTQEGPN